MSDSIKKWHEMQEELKDKKIYESPDGGETVTERPFFGNINDRVVIKRPPSPEELIKKEAYSILVHYSEEAIRHANKLLDFEEQ